MGAVLVVTPIAAAIAISDAAVVATVAGTATVVTRSNTYGGPLQVPGVEWERVMVDEPTVTLLAELCVLLGVEDECVPSCINPH